MTAVDADAVGVAGYDLATELNALGESVAELDVVDIGPVGNDVMSAHGGGDAGGEAAGLEIVAVVVVTCVAVDEPTVVVGDELDVVASVELVAAVGAAAAAGVSVGITEHAYLESPSFVEVYQHHS